MQTGLNKKTPPSVATEVGGDVRTLSGGAENCKLLNLQFNKSVVTVEIVTPFSNV